MRNFNDIFREDVTYNNIKSHKKLGFRILSRRYTFRSGEEEGWGQIDTPAAFYGLNFFHNI